VGRYGSVGDLFFVTAIAVWRIPCSLLSWILGKIAIEGGKLVFPEHAVLRDPLFGGFQRLGRELALADASGLFLGDEAGALEDAEVLHDCRQRHAVGPGEFGDGGLAEHKSGEDGAAGGIGKGTEGGVESSGIVNHMV
jgi:hypothetical protein